MVTTPLQISASRPDRDKISAATPLFSGSSYPMRLTGTLHDQTGSRKSNMAAAKTEVLITQLADQLGTRFQRQNLRFWGSPIQWNQMQCSTTKSEVRNPRWRLPKRKYFRFSVLAAAILDFSLPVQSYSIAFCSIELGNPKKHRFYR